MFENTHTLLRRAIGEQGGRWRLRSGLSARTESALPALLPVPLIPYAPPPLAACDGRFCAFLLGQSGSLSLESRARGPSSQGIEGPLLNGPRGLSLEMRVAINAYARGVCRAPEALEAVVL